MSRTLEPGVRFSIVLDWDKDKPPETQPRFLYRSVNGRQFRRMFALEKMKGTTDNETMLAGLYEQAAFGLVGWENMFDPDTGEAIPFNKADLDLVVDPIEAGELIAKMMDAAKTTPEDKKKLESPA